MHKHMQEPMQNDAFAMLRTDGRTDLRTIYPPRADISHVPERAGENRVFMLSSEIEFLEFLGRVPMSVVLAERFRPSPDAVVERQYDARTEILTKKIRDERLHPPRVAQVRHVFTDRQMVIAMQALANRPHVGGQAA